MKFEKREEGRPIMSDSDAEFSKTLSAECPPVKLLKEALSNCMNVFCYNPGRLRHPDPDQFSPLIKGCMY
jgi:hypothetical protein